MSSQYLTLCVKFRKELGIAGTGPTAVTSQTGMFLNIVDWIADADIEIQNLHLDWGFLLTSLSETLVIGTKDISAPSDLAMYDEDSFYLDYTTDDHKKLTPMDYFLWRNTLRQGTQTNDQPDFIIIKPDQSLIVHPPPDDTYTLTADYYKTPTRMSANTSTSLIPTRFDRLIICKAKMYYAEHENAPEILNMVVPEYQELLNELESLYLPGQQGRTRASNDITVHVV